MILIPTRRGLDLLNFIGYSYQDSEFNIIHRFFRNNKYQYTSEAAGYDRFDRRGELYTIDGRQQIQRLEQQLSVDFHEEEIIFHVIPGGNKYRCMQIKNNAAIKSNCVDLSANDDDEAFFLCAMHAKKENWFGGKSECGRCRDK
jgi:hypothetical protein